MQRILLIGLLAVGLGARAAVPPRLQQFGIKNPRRNGRGSHQPAAPVCAKAGAGRDWEILFAPGMFKADRENFFTYVFLFALERKPVLTAEALRRELLAYYIGLSKARLGNPKLDTSKFSVKGSVLIIGNYFPFNCALNKGFPPTLYWSITRTDSCYTRWRPMTIPTRRALRLG
jgi:hypothetical protein